MLGYLRARANSLTSYLACCACAPGAIVNAKLLHTAHIIWVVALRADELDATGVGPSVGRAFERDSVLAHIVAAFRHRT